jgi:hypothetical protein
LKSEVADGFFKQVLQQARGRQLLSSDHFTVDGTLIEAWAGHKGFQRKDGKGKSPDEGSSAGSSNPTINFHGEECRNNTRRSTTDPEARLFKKSCGSESKLSFMAHVLMENRNGLVVDTRLTKSTGKAERKSAWVMAWRVKRSHKPITLGGRLQSVFELLSRLALSWRNLDAPLSTPASISLSPAPAHANHTSCLAW